MSNQARPSDSRSAPRVATLVVTNATKIAGVVVGINELVIRANTTSARIALAALMMTGAQVSENVLLAIVDRIFRREP